MPMTDFTQLADWICLDAEFAEGVEMLELAIMSGDGRLIYRQRFRPATLKRWRSYPHGITPEMVASEPLFAECRQEIQSVIDAASHVIGFAVEENDLNKLRHEGIHIPETLRIVEIRDWFWITHGRENGLDYRQNVGLGTCCRELGIEIDEEKEHSADYDTECTLRAFTSLIGRYAAKRNLDKAGIEEIERQFAEEFAVEKDRYDRANGAGYCSIIRQPDGRYQMKFSKEPLDTGADIVASVAVANRKKAMVRFSQMLAGKILYGNFRFDRLSRRKLDEFNAYTDSYEADDEQFNSKLLRLAGKFR